MSTGFLDLAFWTQSPEDVKSLAIVVGGGLTLLLAYLRIKVANKAADRNHHPYVVGGCGPVRAHCARVCACACVCACVCVCVCVR